jgi:tRNA/tmRNA/rRNA uracil-C5-methylase (TrmA/RlmC/RlmD family)
MDYVATKGRFGLRMPKRWNFIVELETCHLIPPAAFSIVRQMWLRSRELALPDYDLKTHTGFLRYLVVRRSTDDTLLIGIVTAAGVGGAYDAAMDDLAALALAHPNVVGVHWLVNETITDLSIAPSVHHWGMPTLSIPAGGATLHIGPNTFFQNNVHLLPTLLDEVREAVGAAIERGAIPQVADLYGGVGLIALHLAQQHWHVVLVESHQESATLAAANGQAHDAAAWVQVVAQEVQTYLQQQPVSRFGCVVVDPPRIGLGEAVCKELLRIGPQRIVYVSCNPLTQREDIGWLESGYRLVSLRGYDMFPHTPHVEMLAVLDRR